MEARPVDPRDTDVEVNEPVYRVYFWKQQNADPDAVTEERGWASDEYELTGASDVEEVLRWADGNAEGRRFTVHIVAEKVLIRLIGIDPTRHN